MAERYGATLLVDEAHGLGVVGERGEGLAARLGLTDRDHVVITATLSKSLAAQGGVVLGHPAVRERLVNTARPFIYDTGLAPAAAGAALGALAVLSNDPTLPAGARSNAARLAVACQVPPPAAAVLSLSVAGPEQALAAVLRAQDRGVRIGCFRPPSTPDGSSRIRLTAHAQHTQDEIERACTVLAELMPTEPVSHG